MPEQPPRPLGPLNATGYEVNGIDLTAIFRQLPEVPPDLGFTWIPNREADGPFNGQVGYHLTGGYTAGTGNMIDPDAIAEHARYCCIVSQGRIFNETRLVETYNATVSMRQTNPHGVHLIYRSPNSFYKDAYRGGDGPIEAMADVVNDPNAHPNWKLRDRFGVQVEARFDSQRLWRMGMSGCIESLGWTGTGPWSGQFLDERLNIKWENAMDDPYQGGTISLFNPECGVVGIYDDVRDGITESANQDDGNITNVGVDWDQDSVAENRVVEGSQFHQQGAVALMDDWRVRRPGSPYMGNGGTDGKARYTDGYLPIVGLAADGYQQWDGRIDEYQGTQTGIRPDDTRMFNEVENRSALFNGLFWEYNAWSHAYACLPHAQAYGGLAVAAVWFDTLHNGETKYNGAPMSDNDFELWLLNWVCCWLHYGLIPCPENDGGRKWPYHSDIACLELGKMIGGAPLPSMITFDEAGVSTLRAADQGDADNPIYTLETDKIFAWVNCGRGVNGAEYLSWSDDYAVTLPDGGGAWTYSWPDCTNYQNSLPNCEHLGMRSQNVNIWNGQPLGGYTWNTKRMQARVALKNYI